MTTLFQHYRRRLSIIPALMLLIGLLPMTTQAQQPVVYGVFFYSPSCSHCHIVMDNHWPGFQEEFGEQLQVLFIDVSTQQGSQIMHTATSAMNIPSNGVPMLIIGENVLIGSVQIPAELPGIVREGLAAGGIAYPPIPDIDLVFDYVLGENAAPATATANSGLLDTLTRDPANLLAVLVLGGLLVSLMTGGMVAWRNVQGNRKTALPGLARGQAGWWLIVIGALIGAGLAVSLLIGSLDDGLALALSGGVLLLFGVLLAILMMNNQALQLTDTLIPVMIVAGLLVAGYLAYIETTLVEATCGAIGNCNAVQQSEYAKIAGIPVGVAGIIGYALMLVVWGLNRFGNLKHSDWLLFGLALVGAAFSAYLTFLEPFVIGASCAWCLTSAVVMTMLVWLSLPDVQPSLAKAKVKVRA
jgi:uncharacterized membrane protein